ncbi:MAG TPA: glycosyltransferase family 4 protein [Solirubrobacteraceae bacterium]
MRVSQVLCAAGPVDAVTNQAFAWRRKFDGWGWSGADYAARLAPRFRSAELKDLGELAPAADEVVLVHYSGYAAGLDRVAASTERMLLLSHNITPSRYFWATDPVTAGVCELGREQLAQLGMRAGAAAGVSEFNARELEALSGRPAQAIPVLFEPAPIPRDAVAQDGPPAVLFVGRLAPHKRQDLVIAAFARYRRTAPGAQLTLVGSPATEEFGAWLRELADRLAPGAVRFETEISGARLASHYAWADVFLCLSEHEGFCIPLLEAFHSGVPVLARGAGAITEVVGDAGIVLGAGDDAATAAEAVRLVVEDGELRAELRARGARRLEHYDAGRAAEQLRAAITELAA